MDKGKMFCVNCKHSKHLFDVNSNPLYCYHPEFKTIKFDPVYGHTDISDGKECRTLRGWDYKDCRLYDPTT